MELSANGASALQRPSEFCYSYGKPLGLRDSVYDALVFLLYLLSRSPILYYADMMTFVGII